MVTVQQLDNALRVVTVARFRNAGFRSMDELQIENEMARIERLGEKAYIEEKNPVDFVEACANWILSNYTSLINPLMFVEDFMVASDSAGIDLIDEDFDAVDYGY